MSSTTPTPPNGPFTRPGVYAGEWLPSNVGTYAEAIRRAPQPPPAAPPPPGATAPQRTGRRGLLVGLAGVSATALVAGAGGAVAGTAGTLSYLQREGALGRAARAMPLAAPAAPVVTTTGAIPALDLASMYKAVAPAVVGIEVSNGRGGAGEGSGFIVDDRSHVITNNHVVAGAQRVTLHLLDGTTVPATVVVTDAANDLAVLRAGIPPRQRAVVTLGDSDAVSPGETVIAMGSPFGFEHSITSGIVSAVGRELGGGRRRAAITGLIQTDASINPGNSGGPLFNAAGQVIGVNTMGVGPNSGSVGVNFAVPINAAKRLREQAK